MTLSSIIGGVVTNLLNFGFEESDFELQLHSNVHFRTKTLRKDMNPLMLPSLG